MCDVPYWQPMWAGSQRKGRHGRERAAKRRTNERTYACTVGNRGPRKGQSGTHDPMANVPAWVLWVRYDPVEHDAEPSPNPAAKATLAAHRARSRAMETQTWAVDSEGMKGQTKDKESVYLLVGCRERPGPRSVPFKGGRRENSANYIVQGP